MTSHNRPFPCPGHGDPYEGPILPRPKENRIFPWIEGFTDREKRTDNISVKHMRIAIRACTILDQVLPCFGHLAKRPFLEDILALEKLQFPYD